MVLAAILMGIVALAVLGASPGEPIAWCDWLAWALTTEGLTVLGLAILALVSSYALKLPLIAAWYDGLDSDVKKAIYFAGLLGVGGILIVLAYASCGGLISWDEVWWPMIQRVLTVFGAGTFVHVGDKALRSEVSKRLLP